MRGSPAMWKLLMLAVLQSLSSGCQGSAGPVESQPPIAEQPDPQPLPPGGGAAPNAADHIYVVAANGSGAARLVAGSRPAWSPDGRRIAYDRDGAIRVMALDGSGDVRLSAGTSPAWSPDGARIAFTSADGISVMGVDGSNVRTLVRHDFREDTEEESDQGVGKPAWAPDGARIAFEHLGDGDFAPAQAYIMGSDGSSPRLLTETVNRTRYAESDPSWSPDGAKVVFWSYGAGIAVADIRTGATYSLYRDFPAVAYGARPVWSPDGRTIAFNRGRNSSAGAAVWIMSATGSGARLLIPDGYDAAWSPDGARVAFVSRRTD